jgi:hypothetical protein
MPFPDTLDEFENPGSTDRTDQFDHAGLHAAVNDAIEAIEEKLGTDGSDDENSIDYRVAQLEEGGGGAVDSVNGRR